MWTHSWLSLVTWFNLSNTHLILWVYSLFVCCLTPQQHVSVSQGWICSDNCTCCHTEKEVANKTCYLTPSQYTDTGLTNLSTDTVLLGTWQGSYWGVNFFKSIVLTQPRKSPCRKRGIKSESVDALTTRPTR